MTAGPSDRAGFIDAPVSGPPIRAQNPTVRPTAIGANPGATRSSVATAMITNMRANDITHSRPNAPAMETDGVSDGSVAPMCPTTPSTARDSVDAPIAPTHCATRYGSTSARGNRPVDQNATVTAGFRCAPDR